MSDQTLAFLEKFKGDIEKMKQSAPDMVKGFGGLFQHHEGRRAQDEGEGTGGARHRRRATLRTMHQSACPEMPRGRQFPGGNPRSRQRGGDDAGRPGLHAYSRSSLRRWKRWRRKPDQKCVRKVSSFDKALAGFCANCPVCRRARRRQRGAAFWLVKRVEARPCPFCLAYERVHGRKAHERCTPKE